MTGVAIVGVDDAVAYHLRLVPLAVSVVPAPPTHRLTGVVTVGAEGVFTFTVTEALGLSQPMGYAE